MYNGMNIEELCARYGRPLECGFDDHEPVEYVEPVSAYATPNIEDAWKANEGW